MGRDQRLKARRRPAVGRDQTCVYCGVSPGTTRDHVPPKSLFPSPRPSDLISVPCCEDCRQTQSIDDEYFKNMIVIRRDVAAEPLASRVLDSVHRALARPEGRGFATSVIRSAGSVEMRSLAGLFLGYATTYRPDLSRLDTVMRRTLLGLYFDLMGERLPDSHGAIVYSATWFPNLDAEQHASLKRLVDIAMSGRIRVFGNGVFAYAVQSLADDAHCTVWLFLVYKRVAFIGMTANREDLP